MNGPRFHLVGQERSRVEPPIGREGSGMRRSRRPRVEPDLPMVLKPAGRVLLRSVLAVAREALPYIPQDCTFYLLGKSRILRSELRQALDAFEDHLDQEGQAFR